MSLVVQKNPDQVENVVVKDSAWRESDIATLFGDEPVHFTEAQDLSQLMVELKIYPSTSKARKANRQGEIPGGWSEYKGSKKRFLWIWNPTE